MEHYPKIISVESLSDFRLLILFENQTKKFYDCSRLLTHDSFKLLKDGELFDSVKVDQGGYGISWSDEIDLAESELWINGF